MNKFFPAMVWVVLMLFSVNSIAEVTLPKILSHNMVLQREKPVPIWGTASPGEQVSVNFQNQTKTTTADASGQWKVMLDPLTVSFDPLTMTITGKNIIKLRNLLVGEVWLCSGQSNMEYTLRKNSKIAKPDSTLQFSPVDVLQRDKNRDIRLFLVTSKNLAKPDSMHLGWSVARDSALRSFSAAGYFFAKELYDKLHVPIGMISSAIPGSDIKVWLPGDISFVGKDEKSVQQVKTDESNPGKFYLSMIKPLAPFALKGFLWYQGETNCFQNETIEYTYKMKMLIDGWRNIWNDKNLPFYYVLIAPFYYSKNKGNYPLTEETLPKFWEAQAMASKIPHTGFIVTTDLVSSPEDLHPGFKWEVGRRLAQWPLAKDYHLKITPSGPMYRQMNIKGNKIELDFDYVDGGLISKDGKPLTWFTIAGADGKFVPAQASIHGTKVVVSSAGVPNPVNVRFAWNEAAKPNFYNKENLPAVPFRTDNPLKFSVE